MEQQKSKYLNLILDDFYICKGRLKVYKNVCPTILSAREGFKVLVRNEERKKERRIFVDKAGN